MNNVKMRKMEELYEHHTPFIYYDDISDPDDMGWVLVDWQPIEEGGTEEPRPYALTITDRANVQGAIQEAASTHRLSPDHIYLLDPSSIIQF